jgi:hypothetical protein
MQITYVDGSKAICSVTREDIAQMLKFLDHVAQEPLDDDALALKYQALSQPRKEKLLSNLLASDAPLPTNSPPFKSTIFPAITKQAISMIYQVLGYEQDRTVDESILGMFSVLCPPESITFTKLDYVEFLSEVINFQLSNFHSTKSFRYQAYLVYLIMSNNSSYFKSMGIVITGDAGNTKHVIEWTTEVRRQEQNKGFSLYVNKFMSAHYTLIHAFPPPRMFPQMKKMLQLSKDVKTRDWYLVEDHTLIRVYGFDC